MSKATHVGAALQQQRSVWASWPSDHPDPEKAGRVMRRRIPCERCGEPFTQFKLSERFFEIARFWAHKSGREAAIYRDMPDGVAPLFCPKCERRDLAATAESHFYRPAA